MSAPERGEPGTWRWFGYWDSGQLDTAATLAALAVDDRSASKLITAERPGQIHHCPTLGRSGTWYIWDGRCHKPDEKGSVSTLIGDYTQRVGHLISEARKEVAKRVRIRETGANPDISEAALAKAEQQAWTAWQPAEKYHAGLRRNGPANSLRDYLKTYPEVGISEDELADRWPEHLNCASGVVCLRTGMVYPHDPRWMMTYCLDTAYVPGARGSGWDALIWHVAGENPNVARYLVKMLGYSLLGDNRNQLILFLMGPTGSGKSQVMEAVAKILGSLAHSSSGALIGRSKDARHARVENSLAGKRFVFIDESAERIHIDERQLKKITGASMISVDRLYSPVQVPTSVTFTPWGATNEMPTLNGFDAAIRRRLRCIPCGSTIPGDQQEKKLGERLAAEEGEAILAALVWGAMTFLAEDEQVPPEVELATATYESEQDTAAAFREECTMTLPEHMTAGTPVSHWPSQSRVRQEYVAWCIKTRTTGLQKHAFNTAFSQLPGIRMDPVGKRYLGLQIIQSHLDQDREGSG